MPAVAGHAADHDLALAATQALVDDVHFVELLSHARLLQVALAAFDEAGSLRARLAS